MLIGEWLEPGHGQHAIQPATGTLDDGAGHTLITAYAAHRPDGKWSVLLVNRDQENSHKVSVEFRKATEDRPLHFKGAVESAVFGSGQYRWHASSMFPLSHPDDARRTYTLKNKDGYADPDGPVQHATCRTVGKTWRFLRRRFWFCAEQSKNKGRKNGMKNGALAREGERAVFLDCAFRSASAAVRLLLRAWPWKAALRRG